MEAMFFPGWKVIYQDVSGEEKIHHEIPLGAKLVLSFINRVEAEGGEIKSIVFYANKTLGTINPFYEKAVTKAELKNVSDNWIEQRVREIEKSYPQDAV